MVIEIQVLSGFNTKETCAEADNAFSFS